MTTRTILVAVGTAATAAKVAPVLVVIAEKLAPAKAGATAPTIRGLTTAARTVLVVAMIRARDHLGRLVDLGALLSFSYHK